MGSPFSGDVVPFSETPERRQQFVDGQFLSLIVDQRAAIGSPLACEPPVFTFGLGEFH